MSTSTSSNLLGSYAFRHTSPFGMYPYVPFEILVTILVNLDWRTLVRCSAVCRFWQHAIRDTLALQYKIELGATGLIDGSRLTKNLSIPERMRLLQERRRAWRTLDFRRVITIPTPGECHAYELVGGMFAKAMNPGPQQNVHGALAGMGGGLPAHEVPMGMPLPPGAPGAQGPMVAFTSNPGSRHVSLLMLPGATQREDSSAHLSPIASESDSTNADADGESEHGHGIPGLPEVIVREDVGVLCRDFGIDPTQDLIVLVEQPDLEKPSITIHLRTISTNEKHPSATVPVLKQAMRTGFEGAEIQICDDIIAILVRVPTIPRLAIWQWTTGKLLVCEMSTQVCRNLDDFSMISNYAFMMTCRFNQSSIKVYTFRTSSGRLLFPCSTSPARLSDIRCTTLLLPQLQPNNHYAELSTHTAPFTSSVPAGQAFGSSEEVRVHVMSVLTQPMQAPHSSSDSEIGQGAGGGRLGGGAGGGRPGSFVVILLNRALLRYAERNLLDEGPVDVSEKNHEKEKKKGQGRKGNAREVEVPWDEWGPRSTRWFAERSTHAWQRYVHGSRIVRALHNAWPSTRCRIQVLDFNVHPAYPSYESDHTDEHIDNVEPDCPYFHRLISGPSLIRDRAVFRGGGVESRLAYREVMLKREVGPYSGFMIDEERVIGLSAMAFMNGDMKQIDVFTI